MDANPAPVVLPERFDATTVREVYEALRQALTREGDLHVDGRQVTTVDTAGGQLLAATALTGRHLHLEPSPALSDFLHATALDVVFKLQREP
jgi:anti-anti-sigma regulatory factor